MVNSHLGRRAVQHRAEGGRVDRRLCCFGIGCDGAIQKTGESQSLQRASLPRLVSPPVVLQSLHQNHGHVHGAVWGHGAHFWAGFLGQNHVSDRHFTCRQSACFITAHHVTTPKRLHSIEFPHQHLLVLHGVRRDQQRDGGGGQ